LVEGDFAVSRGNWIMKKKISEQYLSDLFKSMVIEKFKKEYSISIYSLLSEMETAQGKPDFVALTSKFNINPKNKRIQIANAMSKPSSAMILSILKSKSPRTTNYIKMKTAISQPVVKNTLKLLESVKIIERNNNSYMLSENFPNHKLEFWAFELKVENWQRALYQALQYKTFSHRSFVVIWGENIQRAKRQIEKFKTLNVGLIALDTIDPTLEVIHFPRRSKPASKYHYIYALGKFIREM